MDIIGLIKNALLALTAFLELKSKAFYYDIIQKSRANQDSIRNEIEKLRTIGTNDSNDRADLLRKRFAEEKEFAQYISTYYSLSGGK